MISEQNIASLVGGDVTDTEGHKIGTVGQIYVDPDVRKERVELDDNTHPTTH